MSLRRHTLQAILGPRIKIQWIRDNLENVDDIIRRIRTFLKETYPHEPELPITDENELYKGLEYRFLEPYVDTNMTLIDTLIPPAKAHAKGEGGPNAMNIGLAESK